MSTTTPSIPIYQKTIKNYIDYQAAITLVRDLQIKKLRDVTTNKKKRTKQIVGYTIINLEGWEVIQEDKRELQRNKEVKANKLARKKETTAKKKTAVEIKKNSEGCRKEE